MDKRVFGAATYIVVEIFIQTSHEHSAAKSRNRERRCPIYSCVRSIYLLSDTIRGDSVTDPVLLLNYSESERATPGHDRVGASV